MGGTERTVRKSTAIVREPETGPFNGLNEKFAIPVIDGVLLIGEFTPDAVAGH